DSPVSEAAFELHPSRRMPSRDGQKRSQSQWLSGRRGGRSEQAKLTACRKVRGFYRRNAFESRRKGPENREIRRFPVLASRARSPSWISDLNPRIGANSGPQRPWLCTRPGPLSDF